MSLPETHLPAALEAAIIRVKATVVTVAERVATSVGTQAQSATRIMDRDLLLATQIDLRRKINTFHLTFTETLTDKIRQEVLPKHDARRKLASADWQTLTLVEDHEVEERMFSERIGQQISHASEWELREVAAYMGSVLGLGRAEEDRNPLRADLLGGALYRAIEAITADHDARKLLAREFGQFMAAAMPECYKAVVRELQDRNIRPVNLTLKTVDGPGNQMAGHSGYASIHDDPRSTRSGDAYAGGGGGGDAGDSSGRGSLRARGPGLAGVGGSAAGVGGGSGAGARGFGGGGGAGGNGEGNSRNGGPTTGGAMPGGRQAASSPQTDVQLMSLLRRLTFLASRPGGLDAGGPIGSGGGGFGRGGMPGGGGLLSSRGGVDVALGTGPGGVGEAGGPSTNYGENLTGLMAVNLIRAHREELMQASSGKLDHMVIDVVGSLFDQILSDPRVPPQMARQIARLQLPVLRVALVDSTFFSSRRHPVRRFVNRIGSLACAFDEFDSGPGKQLLERVRALVQQIVEGDFDQLDIYTQKLAELESFISQATQQEAEAIGAAGLLEAKESELRIQQRYMQKLQQALDGIAMPPYLRDFTAQVWSQALVQAARRGSPEHAARFRSVGRDLVMSVQPKGSTLLRKKFLMQLPTLMKDLNEGMKLIGWPEAAQKEFFGKLLPSHAESLKAPPMSELEHNLLAKQLEGIFAAPIPAANDFARAEPVMELPSEAMEQQFTPEEAKKVGLVEESAVDWSGEVDIDLSFAQMDAPDTNIDPHPGMIGPDGEASTVPGELAQHIGVDINLDLVTPDPAEPTRGPQLIDHIKLGFAYQMLLKEEWQKVRLNYVSPGRSFFVFSRGRKHQETISLTSRMLARMCESGRLRAVESAYLMERATARARRQLAALKPSSRH